ncbi:hypothetical protein [Flagellimonas crocea]|uniref:hypothetical protein n=1 Tax=Flagellimonas crocea TaxID=3067311 RepID=UPI00296ED6A9|nr:hypothetical protein [Muricauda sp. DH64]
MKKSTPLYILMLFCLCYASYGQNSFPATGSVGIGTLNPNPSYALDVNGTLSATEILVTELNVTNLSIDGTPVQSSPWNLNGNSVFYSGGNVGIGTNNPAYTLDVSGTINATGILINGSPLEGSPSFWVASGDNISYTAGDVGVETLNATNIVLDGTPLENSPSPWTITGSDISYTDGNVNVNVLDATTLRINGTDVVSSPWTISGSDIAFTTGDVDVNTLNATNILLDGTPLENTTSPWTITGSDISYTDGNVDVNVLDATTLRINGTDVVSSPWTTNGNDLTYTTGNIGIGTPTPGYALDVDGTINATNILINGSPLASGSSPWTTSGSDISYSTGNVGIGTSNTQGYMLAVAGNMVAEGVKVELEGNWPDFVFLKDYELQSLKEVEAYIKEHGHLPNVPSAEKIKKDGINLGEMDATLLQKIEELTLHSILQQKEIDSLKVLNQKLTEQNKLIQSLEKRLLKLESNN